MEDLREPARGSGGRRPQDLQSRPRGIGLLWVQPAGVTRGRRWRVRDEAGEPLPWEGRSLEGDGWGLTCPLEKQETEAGGQLDDLCRCEQLELCRKAKGPGAGADVREKRTSRES